MTSCAAPSDDPRARSGQITRRNLLGSFARDNAMTQQHRLIDKLFFAQQDCHFLFDSGSGFCGQPVFFWPTAERQQLSICARPALSVFPSNRSVSWEILHTFSFALNNIIFCTRNEKEKLSSHLFLLLRRPHSEPPLIGHQVRQSAATLADVPLLLFLFSSSPP